MRRMLKAAVLMSLVFNFSVAFSSDTLLDRNALFGSSLEDNGIEVDMTVTQVYQSNVKGGLSTHNQRGRYSGRYDFEITIDGQKMFGLENSIFYIHNRGSWTDTAGIDATSVGSVFGVNGNALGDRAFDIVELWYEQGFADNRFRLRIGKIDMTGGFECRGCPVAFDKSLYANDEITQFLNGALVNNPTIPFPDNGLGMATHYNILDWWYVSAGIADAQADARETGFNTTFRDEDYFFSILETGFVTEIDSERGSLPGAYRVGLWYDPQPKANSDASKNYRDDAGFYLTFDQMMFKENAEDMQGLGTFFRFGYAPSKTNDVTKFVSAGIQYEGLFAGRDSDVFAFGFARGFFSDSADTTYTEDGEAVYEIYYSAEITPAIHITPSIQYIVHPGGVNQTSDATVFGVRCEIAI